jgi:peptidyl-prolyl cis-trans isomerase SurA
MIRFLFVLFAAFTPLVWAKTDRIVAVVNDQVITLSELQERTQLSARAMQMGALTAPQVAALQRRTLMEMIDEQLQQQYASASNMAFTRAELQQAKDAAISTMGQEKWNILTKGLERSGEAKILAEATWARLQTAAVEPRVQVAGPEIDRMIAEMAKSQNRTERNLSMIFIPRETGVSGTDALTLATEVRAQATAPEATAETFAELARTYSAVPSAKQGGALGWMLPGEIPPSIASGVTDLTEGAISEPLPTNEGVILVRINAVREHQKTVDFEPRQERLVALIAAETPSDATAVKALENALKTVSERAKSIAEIKALLADNTVIQQFPRSTIIGWVPLIALQPEVREAVTRTKVGNWSAVFENKGQISRIFVAEERRVMPPEALALRERVQKSLLASRMEMESRRFMRELRQRAFVDIRL